MYFKNNINNALYIVIVRIYKYFIISSEKTLTKLKF